MTKIKNSNIKKVIVSIFSLLLVLTVFIPLTVGAEKTGIPEQKPEFYINDYLGKVDQKVKNYVVNLNDVLYKKTGGQIVFAVTDFSNGLGVEEYTHQMFEEFGIGDKKKNNGILIVVFEEEEGGLFQPQLGDGTAEFISEAKLQDVLEKNFQPYFDDFDTDMAIASTLEALIKIYEKEYNVEILSEFSGTTEEESQNQGNLSPIPQPTPQKSSSGGWVFLVIVLIIVVILLSLSRRRYTSYYSGWMPSYGIRPRWSPFRMYSPFRSYHPFYTPPRPRNRHYGSYNNNNTNYGSGFGTPSKTRDDRPSSTSTPSSQRRYGDGGSSSAPSRGGSRNPSSGSSSRNSGLGSRGGSRSSSSSGGFKISGASRGFGGGSRGGGGGSSSGPSRGGGRRK